MFSLQSRPSGQGGFWTTLSHASKVPLKSYFVHFFLLSDGPGARRGWKRNSWNAPWPPKKGTKIYQNYNRIHFGLQCSVSGCPGVRPPPQNGQKIAPKSNKNPVKIASELHARVCIHFYIGFYRFAECLVLIAKATTCVSYRKIQCFLQVARFTTRAFHMPFRTKM